MPHGLRRRSCRNGVTTRIRPLTEVWAAQTSSLSMTRATSRGRNPQLCQIVVQGCVPPVSRQSRSSSPAKPPSCAHHTTAVRTTLNRMTNTETSGQIERSPVGFALSTPGRSNQILSQSLWTQLRLAAAPLLLPSVRVNESSISRRISRFALVFIPSDLQRPGHRRKPRPYPTAQRLCNRMGCRAEHRVVPSHCETMRPSTVVSRGDLVAATRLRIPHGMSGPASRNRISHLRCARQGRSIRLGPPLGAWFPAASPCHYTGLIWMAVLQR